MNTETRIGRGKNRNVFGELPENAPRSALCDANLFRDPKRQDGETDEAFRARLAATEFTTCGAHLAARDIVRGTAVVVLKAGQCPNSRFHGKRG